MEKKDEYAMPTLSMCFRSEPDVPEDTAITLLHLNDPNWDSEISSLMTRESTDFDHKDPKRFGSSLDVRRSTTEYDSESQTDSRLHFRSTEAIGYEECVAYSLANASS